MPWSSLPTDRSIAELPLHATIGEVVLQLGEPAVSIRQGESVSFPMTVTSVAGPDTIVSVDLHGGSDSTGLTCCPPIRNCVRDSHCPGPDLSVGANFPPGSYDTWVIAEAFDGRQGANDARGHFLGVPLTVLVTAGKVTVRAAGGRLPILEGRAATLPVDATIGGEGQMQIIFTDPDAGGIGLDPPTQWITVVNNADFLPGMPDNNVDARGTARGSLTLTAAAGYLHGAPQLDVTTTLHWITGDSAQTGSLAVDLAVFAPTAHMTGFDPTSPQGNGYGFVNYWHLTTAEAETLRNYFANTLDEVMSVCDVLVAESLIGIAGLPITAVVEEVSPSLRNQIHDAILSAPPGAIGMCGGMAFSAVDFYDNHVTLPAVARLSSQPDATTPDGSRLRDYIWRRLLDSLTANGSTYLKYLVTLHILPGLVGGALGAIVGAAVGSSVGVAGGAAEGSVIGGPVGGVIGGIAGGVIGAVAGGDTIVIDLGGSKKLMEWSREAWNHLKIHLDAGEAWPIGIVSNSVNPMDSHQVVAIGYDDRNGPQQIDLYVYDDNNVYASSNGLRRTRISLDLRGDTMQSTTDDPDSSWMPLQGIICSDYNAQQPPSFN